MKLTEKIKDAVKAAQEKKAEDAYISYCGDDSSDRPLVNELHKEMDDSILRQHMSQDVNG